MTQITDTLNAALRRVPMWVVYCLYLLPVPWLLYLAQTGGLGREPIKALEHELGEIALQLLIIGLCVTPLRQYLGLNLLRFRRAFGLLAFIYVALHLTVWVLLDMSLLWSQMWADIWKRPYITVGMAGFVLLIPLALTSSNAAIRKLGPIRWNRLHKLVYLAVILGAVHFVWLSKGFQIEPLMYLLVALGLVALRFVPKRSPGRRRAR